MKRDAVRAKALIDKMVAFLNNDKLDLQARRDLWNIITGLRGPDNDNDQLKDETTGRIRAAVGLKQNSTGFLVSNGTIDRYTTERSTADTIIVSNLRTNMRAEYAKITHHFFSHVNYAVLALKSLEYIKGE